MKVGDLVKFSKEHRSSPGLDYTESWIGIVIGATPSPDNRRRLRRVPNFDELEIAWTIHGGIRIMGYNEEWWNKLDYEPFEVINEIELTDEQLENVCGGMNQNQFDNWRCGVINESR